MTEIEIKKTILGDIPDIEVIMNLVFRARVPFWKVYIGTEYLEGTNDYKEALNLFSRYKNIIGTILVQYSDHSYCEFCDEPHLNTENFMVTNTEDKVAFTDRLCVNCLGQRRNAGYICTPLKEAEQK